MRTTSDHLGAWIVAGVLALALVVADDGTSSQLHAGLDPQFCSHADVTGAVLPGTDAWRPNPVMAGLPDDTSQNLSPYELDEERDLARLQRTSREPVTALAAYGSSTSLKPIRMC